MTTYTSDEQAYLNDFAQRLAQLRDFLNSADITNSQDTARWFEYAAKMKTIQGNTNNTLSFLACLLAKEHLMARFNVHHFDVAAKSQGASGLDIDVHTLDGKRIIGEIKTTVPYSGAKNDFGARQKETIQHDLDKLKNSVADYKFFFVTDKATLEVVQRKYMSQLTDVKVILLADVSHSQNP